MTSAHSVIASEFDGAPRAVPHAATRARAVVVPLVAILFVATCVRLLLFTGLFGSDEVVFLGRAVDILDGKWTTSYYIGGVRYGVTIPMAIAMRLFGRTEFAANLWPFLCSVGEVALVYITALQLWGRRPAILAALVLSVLPIHVHMAGRLMLDPPNAFFVTLSFVLFLFGERRNDWRCFLGAGLAAGCAFWVREASIVFVLAFVMYAAFSRRWSNAWLWAVAGALCMFAVNFLLFWQISGSPFHGIRVLLTSGLGGWTDPRIYEGNPLFYLRYLFFDIKHTWLLGYLAALAITAWVRNAGWMSDRDPETTYVVIWFVGLLVAFSLIVASVHPLMFIRKQTNYMLIFMAPAALLAGRFTANLNPRLRAMVVGCLVAGSLGLAAAEQQAIRVFTANSKAAIFFAARRPERPTLGSVAAVNASAYYSMLQVSGFPAVRIEPLTGPDHRAGAIESTDPSAMRPAREDTYVVFDEQTMKVGSNTPRGSASAPACWSAVESLVPPLEHGIGTTVLRAIKTVVDRIPGRLPTRAASKLNDLLLPAPATVYAVPRGCVI